MKPEWVVFDHGLSVEGFLFVSDQEVKLRVNSLPYLELWYDIAWQMHIPASRDVMCQAEGRLPSHLSARGVRTTWSARVRLEDNKFNITMHVPKNNIYNHEGSGEYVLFAASIPCSFRDA